MGSMERSQSYTAVGEASTDQSGSTYVSDAPPQSSSVDPTSGPTNVTAEDAYQCCLCYCATDTMLTLPSCAHAFCSACIQRVGQSPTPEFCPICLADMHSSEGAYLPYCIICTQPEATLSSQCVHCEIYLCEECAVDHDQKPGYEGHIVLKLTYPHQVHTDNGWSDEIGPNGACQGGEWYGPGPPNKGWSNDETAAAADHSWSARNLKNIVCTPMEKVWSYAGEKGCMNSTWTSVAAASEKGWPNGPAFDSSQLDPNDDDSLLIYGCGGDSSEFTTSSSAGEDHRSAYEHIHSSSAEGDGSARIKAGFDDLAAAGVANQATSPKRSTENCARHDADALTHFCKTCETGVCDACASRGGDCGAHECVRLAGESARHDCATLLMIRDRTRAKSVELNDAVKRVNDIVEGLKRGFQDDEQSIRNAFDCFLKALIDRRAESSAELRHVYSARMERLNSERDAVLYNVQQLTEANELIRTLLLLSGQKQLTQLFSRLHETIDKLFEYVPEIERAGMTTNEISFVANQHAMQAAVRNTFGYLRHGPSGAGSCPSLIKKVYSSAELTSSTPGGHLMTVNNGSAISANHKLVAGSQYDLRAGPDLKQRLMGGAYGSMPQLDVLSGGGSRFGDGGGSDMFRSRKFPSSSTAVGGPSSVSKTMLYENRSTALRNGFSILSVESEDEMSKVIMPSICPSDFKRKKMEYHCKFGEFGSDSNQFYEPSGVAVTMENDILVADANNHRIQAFDRNGNYLRTIGQDHKGSEGDLVYPNRLTVNRTTGDIIVTERSPTHQVNVYNREGRFVRKFGASVLQHPRGITVDNLGRIIVVECKVMRVVIFSVVGSVLNRFVVDKHVNFPNGVAVNDREEIFISDNRRHGVVVFNYHGAFLRTVGGMGITNYPIGVGINSAGEVVVADNHNNFNVTVFTQDGIPIRALESRVKHAQCFDIALLDRNSIVLSSKDFRVYVYQYAPSASSNQPLTPGAAGSAQ